MKTAIVVLVAVWVGLEAGYRIGVQNEVQTHTAYIKSLNLGGAR